MFIGHGNANSLIPLDSAKRDFRVLYSAGVDVQMFTYPTAHHFHPHMFRDINRWIMRNVNAELEEFEDPDDYNEET